MGARMKQPRKIIPTWVERCNIYSGIPTHSMIQDRMQSEIDDLRLALERMRSELDDLRLALEFATQKRECISACVTHDLIESLPKIV